MRAVRFLALVAGMAIVAVAAAGCVIVKPSAGYGSLGTSNHPVTICASGDHGGLQCPERGNMQMAASAGFRQVLVGARVPAGVGAPATLLTPAPQSLTLAASPSFAAELQRLQPAPAGQKWVAWITPSLNYDPANADPYTQAMSVVAAWQLPRAADGSPFPAATITSTWVVGVRNVTSEAPPGRPVTCGDSLTTINLDTQSDTQTEKGFTFCEDSRADATGPAPDYGVVATGARASGQPGSLVSLPFIVRTNTIDPGGVPSATLATTLPGASVAMTPSALPALKANADSTGIVAVGIPAGAAPGSYGVTLTVKVQGETRVGVGTVVVLPGSGGGGGGGGGAAGPSGAGGSAKRKLTTILPKGLTVAAARTGGVPVLLGSTVAGPSLVKLQQGPKKKPTLSIGKRVRLKVPGPVKVTFKSRKLAKGPYRVTISVSGKVVKTVAGRLLK